MDTAEILTLSKQCDSLQHSGKYAECIENMEQLLEMKQKQFGEGSVECAETIEKLCEVLNFQAMISLQCERFTSSLENLKRAEELSGTSLKLKATTLNNLACFYRRTGKLRTAYNYLQSAFELELKIGSCPSLADTHLNLCAVLSQLDRHQQALEHSLLSIVLLQDEFLQPALKIQKDSQQQQKKNAQLNPDRIAVLAIAFHNLGVELEHLKRYEESIQIYKRALGFAKDNLGHSHALVKNLQKIVKTSSVSQEGGKVKVKANNVNGNRPRAFKEKPERLDKLGKDINMIAAPSSTQSVSRRNPSPSAVRILTDQDFNRNLPRFSNTDQLTGCLSRNNETDFCGQRIPRDVSGQERVVIIQKDHRSMSAMPRRKKSQQRNSSCLRGENGYNLDYSYPQRNYSAVKTNNSNASSQNNNQEYLHCKTENHNYELNLSTPISLNNMVLDPSFKNDNGIAYNNYNIVKQPLELTSQNIGYPSSFSPSQNINQLRIKTNVHQSPIQNTVFLQHVIQQYALQPANRGQPTFPIDASVSQEIS